MIKPVETGVMPMHQEFEGDTSKLRSILPKGYNQDFNTGYQFAEPLAPLEASRLARQSIDFNLIKNRYQMIANTFECILVECVGGVMVPLVKKKTIRDLIHFLDLPCIIISRTMLGAVNHTLLTIEALSKKKVEVLAIVLNNPTPPSASKVEQLQIKSTIKLIQELSGVPVVGPLPYEKKIETRKSLVEKNYNSIPDFSNKILFAVSTNFRRLI